MRLKPAFSKLLTLIIIIILIGIGAFIYLSPSFEQEKPQITFESNGFWNLKDQLEIELEDNSGIKSYQIVFKDKNQEIVLQENILETPLKKINIQIDPPKLDIFYKETRVQIIIKVTDKSKWNFLKGNNNLMLTNLQIDTRKPLANVISNSRYIKRAGSAIAIVKVEDTNLDKAYIDFCSKAKYTLVPFYKKNYYAALIPWDINIKYEDFSQVNLVAIDKAGNITQTKIPFYIQDFKEKRDSIAIDERFITSVSTNVLKQSNINVPENLVDIFIEQNEHLRAKNIETIKKIATHDLDKEMVKDFHIKPFKRLPRSRTAAGYGEWRNYYYENEKIDDAWHLGMDWASIRQAPIIASNSGMVVFNQYLGIYGNTLIINHGLGLSSLYAHTTNQFVTDGKKVKANEQIATTGISGAVLGDHLHFGILVQGIEVNPVEWMDKDWIKTRIFDIISNAKKIINKDK